MMKQLVVILLLLIIADLSYGQSVPSMTKEDKLRIREAVIISEKYGEQIWSGIGMTTFAIVLVTDSIEFLVFHPAPTPDFSLSEHDSILNAKIYWRKRQFSKGLLATFPAVGGVNCIVAGTPVNTGKNTTEWIITLLHEHFHQYVYSQPDYYTSVEKLDLSGSDQTGMWMLNYPFPYSKQGVAKQYNKYVLFLSKAVSGYKIKDYLNQRKKLKEKLKPADYRYFSFQLWQEGIARYTEYKFLEAMKTYQPSQEIAAMDGFISFADYKEKLYADEIRNLQQLKLPDGQRVCFYASGFAEGILLDKVSPTWRENFLKNKFYLENYQRGYK
jgi:hypothetical protein